MSSLPPHQSPPLIVGTLLMDILSLSTLMPYFEDAWHRMRAVSREGSRWAHTAFEARRATLELDFARRMEHCQEIIARRALLFESTLSASDMRFSVDAMAVLSGTAALVHRVLLIDAREQAQSTRRADRHRIRTFEDIMDRACPGADFDILLHVPLRGRLRFAHIQEMMAMVGELRMAVAMHADPVWSCNGTGVEEAADAYARLQMHRWAWPERGLYDQWLHVDI